MTAYEQKKLENYLFIFMALLMFLSMPVKQSTDILAYVIRIQYPGPILRYLLVRAFSGLLLGGLFVWDL